MRIRKTKNNHKKTSSALVLVVVVTALLSVIGVIFVMTMRMREMTTSNITDNRDLDAAVHSTVGQIGTILVQDLFGTSLNKSIIDGTGGNEPYDSLGTNDRWLASLEPVLYDQRVVSDPTDDWYQWERITDLSGGAVASKWDLVLRNGKKTSDDTGKDWDITKKEFGGIVEDYQEFDAIFKQTPEYVRQHPDMAIGLPADADDDGVADSMWIKLPNLSTSKAKPVFAAVRIVDNCAMLNLNTAYCFYQKLYSESATSPFEKIWYINQATKTMGISYPNGSSYADGGRYLSEINYLPFLRGRDLNGVWGSNVGDGWYNLLAAKRFCQVSGSDSYSLTSQLSTGQCQTVLMDIENAGKTYNLFDIGDELEIRNRFLLTSRVESRFERKDVANYTFDAGGGIYAALEIPRDGASHPISDWKVRIDPKNFDLWSGGSSSDAYKYDRRHVCTFYSFDRNIRTGKYPLIDVALQSPALQLLSAAQRQTIEGFFRPINNRPIDLRSIDITSNLPTARKNILYLLYAFREYYLPSNFSTLSATQQQIEIRKAAIKAAQIVANMIDYLDDNTTTASGPFGSSTFGNAGIPQKNADPIYINRAIVRQMILEVSTNAGNPIDIGQYPSNPLNSYEFGLGITNASETVYGYERQPFISEIYCQYDGGVPGGAVRALAIELVNPYSSSFDLSGWKIRLGTLNVSLTRTPAIIVPAATGTTPAQYGRHTLWYAESSTYNPGIPTIPIPITSSQTPNFSFFQYFGINQDIRLLRPDPSDTAKFVTIDRVRESDINKSSSETLFADGIHSAKRDDNGWKFANNSSGSYSIVMVPDRATTTLGVVNGINLTPKGFALPVANTTDPTGSGNTSGCVFPRLGDFQKVAWVEPNELTNHIANAASEAKVRFDATVDPGLLGYICTLNRSQGNLPGRININTAPKYVIAAAIPPQLTDPNLAVNALTLAEQIVAYRPYTNLGDLLKVPMIKRYLWSSAPNVGDTGMDNDLEERDWILSRLSNIFTVRSDTFTAYILVRLGTDGPQRRMLAIFDRSNVWSSADKPKLVALHPVPDPR